MKLEHYPMVQRHVAARTKLLTQMREGKLAIWIDGEKMDDDLLGVAVPVIQRELMRRVDEIDEDLRALGVDPD